METLRVELAEGGSGGGGKEKKGHCRATDLSPAALMAPCNHPFAISILLAAPLSSSSVFFLLFCLIFFSFFSFR